MKQLHFLPVGSIRPEGLLRQFLETQMSGLTGHIERAGYPFETPKWGEEYRTSNQNPQWWAYEQNGYWIDGFTRAAILLGDAGAIARAREIIYRVMENPDRDGYLGPSFMKETSGANRWPHAVFFRAVMAMYDYNADAALPAAVARHYLGAPVSHAAGRDVMNVEAMLWAYEKTGDPALLKMAEKNYRDYNIACEGRETDLCDRVAVSPKKPYAHGVSYNEYAKLGALLYRETGSTAYLEASVSAYQKIDRYFMLPSGCHCSDEYLWSDDYMRATETCDISDYTWSLGCLLSATGDTHYADRLEACIFNAGIGAATEDFRALQYLSCANQVIADAYSNHNDFYKGSRMMSYRPNPGTECCPGNINRFMPNYVVRQYLADAENGIYSLLFGAGHLSYHGIEIDEVTQYPFIESVCYRIRSKKPFLFHVRIPAYATCYHVRGSGSYREEDGFLLFDVQGDAEITVSFDSAITPHEKDGHIYYTKGPLTYSFPVPTDCQVDTNDKRSDPDFPAYNMYPADTWQYGLLAETPHFHPATSPAWRRGDGAPTLTVQARRIRNWDILREDRITRITSLRRPMQTKELEGKFAFTPRIPLFPEPEGDAVTLTLYPFGLTKLRMTVFPVVDP